MRLGLILVALLSAGTFICQAQTPRRVDADVNPRDVVQGSAYDDDFSTKSLDSKWQRVRVPDGRWRIVDDGFLALQTGRGDIAQWVNNAPMFVQKAPPGDWVVQTNVCATPTENFQQAGLIVTGQGIDHVRITLAFINGLQIEFLREAGGTRRTSQLRPPASPCYELRISREGTTYKGYYRLPGHEWRLVGECRDVELRNPSFGLTGFNGANDSERPMEAMFDYFRVR